MKRAPNKDPEAFGYSYGVGDIVGCGWDRRNRAIFFTCNGAMINKAFLLNGLVDEDSETLYPVVLFRGTFAKVQVNFGQQPFAFDFNSLVLEKEADIRPQGTKKGQTTELENDHYLEPHTIDHLELTSVLAGEEVDEEVRENETATTRVPHFTDTTRDRVKEGRWYKVFSSGIGGSQSQWDDPMQENTIGKTGVVKAVKRSAQMVRVSACAALSLTHSRTHTPRRFWKFITQRQA